MSESYGTMMSGKDALKLLDEVCSEVDASKHGKGFSESLSRMKNRFAYHIGQAEQMKPKYHKGRHGSRYDWWTCSNCGCELTHDVGQNYCWNCGHMIMWGNPRCLTK